MVDILLATYNGQKYLEDQLDSIINQSFKDWKLIIHDDGSTDKTRNLIDEFIKKDSRIILIDDNKNGLGVSMNFVHLLKHSHSQFVMFCDQDDIWLNEKVEIMFNEILKKNNEIPQAVFSNSYLWNENDGVISNKNTLTYPRTLEELLFLNTGIQGAAGIFNDKLRNIIKIPLNYYAMHDHVLTLSAIIFGEIDYIDKPLMYYRQHGENVTGNAPGSFINKFAQLLKHTHITVIDSSHYKGLAAFYEVHQNNITMTKKQIIETFLELPNVSSLKRISIIVNYKFKLFNSTSLLLLKIFLRKFHSLTVLKQE